MRRDFPNVRAALSEEYRRLPEEQLDELVRETFGESFAIEDAEGFLGTLAKIGAVAAPIVLPAVGNAIAPGAGGVIGGIAGNLAAQALSGVGDDGGAPAAAPPPPQRQVAAAPRPHAPRRRAAAAPPPPAPQPPRRPRIFARAAAASGTVPAAAATGMQSSAAQLAGVLGRPEFLLALASALFGSAGRPTVPVGDADVPVGSLLNLIPVLGDAARVENHLAQGGGTEAVPSYLFTESGEAKCEVTDERERAEVLLGMLAEVAAAEAEDFESDEGYEDDEDYEWVDEGEMADAYELAVLELGV